MNPSYWAPFRPRVRRRGRGAGAAGSPHAGGPAGVSRGPGAPRPWTRLSDGPPLSVEQLDGADAVVTGVTVAAAVTGTVILNSGQGQGRSALTLLPDQHVCVVRASQIVGDAPEAITRLDPFRPLVRVSGPSAASDIELDRVEGVAWTTWRERHGPRNLDNIVVTEDPSLHRHPIYNGPLSRN